MSVAKMQNLNSFDVRYQKFKKSESQCLGCQLQRFENLNSLDASCKTAKSQFLGCQLKKFKKSESQFLGCQLQKCKILIPLMSGIKNIKSQNPNALDVSCKDLKISIPWMSVAKLQNLNSLGVS